MNVVEFDRKCKLFFESFLLFYSGWNKGNAGKVDMKKMHCYRVSELAGNIAVSLHLNTEDVALARITGLLHDLGRFPQLVKYNTYDDSVSADHAAMAIDELDRSNIFQEIDSEIAGIIKVAIYQHNKPVLPENLSERETLFCNILRDADKLDNLYSLTEYYTNPNPGMDHSLHYNLPGGLGISDDVALAAKSGKTVAREALRTRDDLKVMQLSWVYGLNFKASFRILTHERYVDIIYGSLPKRDVVIDIYRSVRIYIENKFLN
jgi:HD superfamily phosphodiesterase